MSSSSHSAAGAGSTGAGSLNPSTSNNNNNNPSKPKGKSSRSSTLPNFTPLMQDRQARNKDPYASSSSESPFDMGWDKRFDAYGNDTYENIQKRREAAIVLDCPELLMMHAQARNDSIPGTRNYFTKLLCGYITPEEEIHDSYSAPAPQFLSEQELERARRRRA